MDKSISLSIYCFAFLWVVSLFNDWTQCISRHHSPVLIICESSTWQINLFHLCSRFVMTLPPGLCNAFFPNLVFLQESEFDSNKRADSLSEGSPALPKGTSTSHNPKYQLFLSNEVKTNGLSSRDADGPGGSGGVGGNSVDQWKSTEPKQDEWRGSTELLLLQDGSWPDRIGEVNELHVCVCAQR